MHRYYANKLRMTYGYDRPLTSGTTNGKQQINRIKTQSANLLLRLIPHSRVVVVLGATCEKTLRVGVDVQSEAIIFDSDSHLPFQKVDGT